MEARLRLSVFLALAALLIIPLTPRAIDGTGIAHAQAEDDAVEDEEDLETEPGGDEEDEEIRLRAPQVEMLELEAGAEEEGEGAEEEGEPEAEAEDDDEEADSTDDEETLPSPEDADARLTDSGTEPVIQPWASPHTVFELHGYMRMRGEFQDQFSLGRGRQDPDVPDFPFENFIPLEDQSLLGGAPDGGCAGARGDMSSACDQRALAYANMRLRLEPTIHLSDDVRVRMQFDVFDNLVMGSTPQGRAWDLSGNSTYSSYAPLVSLSQTQTSPSDGRNSLTDSILARRAWAEIRNRGLGELRFGRMGSHWGLGIFQNDGRGIDSDYQVDVDRIMAITRLFGIYLFGAWDFAGEGFVQQDFADYNGVPTDRSRLDDVDQFTFGAAYRMTPEEQATALQRGDFVLNVGAYFQYRTQNLTSEGTAQPLYAQPGTTASQVATFVRRGAETYTPDLWVQFLWGDLRLEAEAVMVIGTLDNTSLTTFDSSSRLNLLQFGVAFEGEYHLLNDQLGIYFNAGFATGDANCEGLQSGGGACTQQPTSEGTDGNATAFAFHPNYRIDLIFWRNVMRQFGGAYYFRPGVSYDFIRSSFGQLLGARADVVWSRASEPVQTWGNQPDIGVEIDAQVYYRSEDGPDILDGFYASIQYGIFFPLGAVGFLPGEGGLGRWPGGGQNAQTLRLVLGVQY